MKILSSAGVAKWREEGGCGSLSPLKPGQVMPWLCNLRAGHDGPHQDMPGDDVPTWSDE